MTYKGAGRMKVLGKHLIAEFMGCKAKLDTVSVVKQAMERAAIKARATIVQSVFHRFNPYGISGVVVIAESHLTIHTWPEFSYAAVDIFTCGEQVDPWCALKHLEKELKSDKTLVQEWERGPHRSIVSHHTISDSVQLPAEIPSKLPSLLTKN